MKMRMSDDKQHLGKWQDCYKTAALLARKKAVAYLRADGTYLDDGQVWIEIAAFFERKAKGGRGFLALSPRRQSLLAALGGKKAHQAGTAHVFSAEQARAAGSVGGRKVSRDRQYMSFIGRRGGLLRGRRAGGRKKTAPDIAQA